jgi:hypothetical protein
MEWKTGCSCRPSTTASLPTPVKRWMQQLEVLILCLSAIAPYMSGHVVDRGGNSTIESFAVHPRV